MGRIKGTTILINERKGAFGYEDPRKSVRDLRTCILIAVDKHLIYYDGVVDYIEEMNLLCDCEKEKVYFEGIGAKNYFDYRIVKVIRGVYDWSKREVKYRVVKSWKAPLSDKCVMDNKLLEVAGE